MVNAGHFKSGICHSRPIAIIFVRDRSDGETKVVSDEAYVSAVLEVS